MRKNHNVYHENSDGKNIYLIYNGNFVLEHEYINIEKKSQDIKEKKLINKESSQNNNINQTSPF